MTSLGVRQARSDAESMPRKLMHSREDSEMTQADLQMQLDRFYSELRERPMVPLHKAHRYSAPLLIKLTTEWMQSRRRMLIIGKATREWGLDRRWHLRDGDLINMTNEQRATSCRHCPFDEVKTFMHFLEREDAIPALQHAYEVFDLGRNQKILRVEGGRTVTKSQFWRAFHRLMSLVEGPEKQHATLWSNLTISDFENAGALNTKAHTANRSVNVQDLTLPKQLEILQPGATVFFVGEYKPLLMRLFPGLEWQELHDGRPDILVARNAPAPLPAKTVWAWHPRLWRRETWDQLPRLAEWIAEA
jgi:hypothetical protein